MSNATTIIQVTNSTANTLTAFITVVGALSLVVERVNEFAWTVFELLLYSCTKWAWLLPTASADEKNVAGYKRYNTIKTYVSIVTGILLGALAAYLIPVVEPGVQTTAGYWAIGILAGFLAPFSHQLFQAAKGSAKAAAAAQLNGGGDGA